MLADVEAVRALTVVPIEAIPIRPMAGSGRWALFAARFAAAHVLLAVDDAIGAASPIAQIGATCPAHSYVKSLHKTGWSDGKALSGMSW